MGSRMDEFCSLTLLKYGEPSGIAPGDLAREFVKHAGLSSFPSFMELYAKLKQYGVDEITGASLPDALKGHHFKFQGKSSIQYEANAWSGSVEFTMGHELFEIIHETFEGLVPAYRRPLRDGTDCMGAPANRFSAALWMRPEVFTEALFASGFDLVQLRHRFQKSYASVGIRAIDVVNQWNARFEEGERVDFIVAIYERQEPESNPDSWSHLSSGTFTVQYALRTRGIKLGRRGGRRLENGSWSRANYRAPRYPGHLIPGRGDRIVSESVAYHVIRLGHPVYLNLAWGFDFWGFNELCALGLPVIWGGKIAKVVLVAMRRSHSHLLAPSVRALDPWVMRDSFQIL